MALRLPLPGFVVHPVTSVSLGLVHAYLGVGHLSELFGGEVQWTHIWKGFGAIAGAYIFAALASRGIAQQRDRRSRMPGAGMSPPPSLEVTG